MNLARVKSQEKERNEIEDLGCQKRERERKERTNSNPIDYIEGQLPGW